jgi:hypothetical protein
LKAQWFYLFLRTSMASMVNKEQEIKIMVGIFLSFVLKI